MTSKSLWLIPALFIGYIIYKKYVLSTKVSVFFNRIDLSKMSFTNPEIGIVVEITNPTDTTAQIDDVNGRVLIDGIEVGRVFGIAPTKINSGSSMLRIPGTLSYQGVGELINKFNTKGFKFQFEKSTKSVFKFEETAELTKNVDEYLNSEAICDPLLFTNSIKNIKSLLYNKK